MNNRARILNNQRNPRPDGGAREAEGPRLDKGRTNRGPERGDKDGADGASPKPTLNESLDLRARGIKRGPGGGVEDHVTDASLAQGPGNVRVPRSNQKHNLESTGAFGSRSLLGEATLEALAVLGIRDVEPRGPGRSPESLS